MAVKKNYQIKKIPDSFQTKQIFDRQTYRSRQLSTNKHSPPDHHQTTTSIATNWEFCWDTMHNINNSITTTNTSNSVKESPPLIH